MFGHVACDGWLVDGSNLRKQRIALTTRWPRKLKIGRMCVKMMVGGMALSFLNVFCFRSMADIS